MTLAKAYTEILFLDENGIKFFSQWLTTIYRFCAVGSYGKDYL